MYSIYCDSECIYNDEFIDDKYKLTGMSLELKDNSAGTLKFTMSKSNHGYDLLKRFSSIITVYRERKWLWSGRAIQEETNFNNDRVITCEGELNYLLDTIQPPSYGSYTVRGYLEKLISIHNSKCESYKQFNVGLVTVTDPNNKISRYTNYENTLKEMSDDLIDDLGGHFKIRHESSSGVDVRYLDYIEDDTLPTAMQTIEFGKNLSDFAKNYSANNIATVIIPRGARLDTETIQGLDDYLTVASVNAGSIYVSAPQEVLDTYGRIEKVVDWDDITLPRNLLNKAQKYLLSEQWEDLIIKISAVDLHYLNPDIESISLLDKVRCRSAYHGMDTEMTCTEIKIDLGNPNGVTYTLSKNGTVNTLSASSSQANNELNKKIDTRTQGSLAAAREESKQIMDRITSGYITIKYNDDGSQELWIAETPDPDTAIRYWRWNSNGLMYTDDGGNTYKVGMRMDGTMIADLIKSGRITSDDGDSYFDLTTGEIKAHDFYMDGGKIQVMDNLDLKDLIEYSYATADGGYDWYGSVGTDGFTSHFTEIERNPLPGLDEVEAENSTVTVGNGVVDLFSKMWKGDNPPTFTNYRLRMHNGIIWLQGDIRYYSAGKLQGPSRYFDLGRGDSATPEMPDYANLRSKDYCHLGTYWCSNSTKSATFGDYPCFGRSGFKLVVMTTGSDQWYNGYPTTTNDGDIHRQQWIYNNNGEIWVREISGKFSTGLTFYPWTCLRGHWSSTFTCTPTGTAYDLSPALQNYGDMVELTIVSGVGSKKFRVIHSSSANSVVDDGGLWTGPTLTVSLDGSSTTNTVRIKTASNLQNCRLYIKPLVYNYMYAN